MRTAMDVEAELLANMPAILEIFGITKLDERKISDNVIRLTVDGAWLPEADLITISFDWVAVNHVMQITARAKPVDDTMADAA